MKNRIWAGIFLGALAALGWTGCVDIQTGKSFRHLAPGVWRGVFVFDEASKEKIPYTFEVKNTDNDQPIQIEFFNGDQRLRADSVRFWGDTAFVYFRQQKTHLRLIFEVNLVEGYLMFDDSSSRVPLKTYAQAGQALRYPDVRRQPLANIASAWTLKAATPTADSSFEANLELRVDENRRAIGKIQLPNRPMQHLEGTAQGNQLYLSGFDGQQVVQVQMDLAAASQLERGSLWINDERYVLKP